MSGFYCNILILAILGSSFPTPTRGWSSAAETSLKGSLLSGYKTQVRPEETVQVYVGFQMTAINGVNIKDQTFSVSGWWLVRWSDSRLAWTPSSHSNINLVQFSPDHVWTPALVISNDVITLAAMEAEDIPVRVSYDGTVRWNPSGINTLKCEMDTSKFPFDDHTCNIQVTSTGYTLDEVICNTTRGVEMLYYQENGEWEIRGVWNRYEAYQDHGNDYSRITFYINVHRLNDYYWPNLLVPVILASWLVAMVFAVPADSGEKAGYSLTCLLTFVVLLTLIANDIPTSAKHINIIDVYMCIVLILSAMSVLISIFSIKYFNVLEDEAIPGWMVSVVVRCWPWVDDREHQDTPEDGPKEAIASTDNDEGFEEIVPQSEGTPETTETSSVVTNPSPGRYDAGLVTGKVISKVMDAMMLRIFGGFVAVLTLIIMIVIVS